MATANEKGASLEEAVIAIESFILRSSPALTQNIFNIISRKILIVDGVRHEIDVWVEIEISEEYKLIYIFECKNWTDKVGKNEIIIFSEKIRVSRAQKGIFVAKSFTSDAVNQANLDPRIELVIATEYDPTFTPRPLNFHIVHTEIILAKVRLTAEYVVSQDHIKNCLANVQSESIILAGRSIYFKQFAEDWARVVADEYTKLLNYKLLENNLHEIELTDVRLFLPSWRIYYQWNANCIRRNCSKSTYYDSMACCRIAF